MKNTLLGILVLLVSCSFGKDHTGKEEAFLTAVRNYYAPKMDRLGLESIDSLKVIAVRELTETEFNLLALEILERKRDFVQSSINRDTECEELMGKQMTAEREHSTGLYDTFKVRRDECIASRDSFQKELPPYVKAADSCKQLLERTDKMQHKGYLVTIYMVQHNKERPAVRGQVKYLISDDMKADYLVSDKLKRFYED